MFLCTYNLKIQCYSPVVQNGPIICTHSLQWHDLPYKYLNNHDELLNLTPWVENIFTSLHLKYCLALSRLVTYHIWTCWWHHRCNTIQETFLHYFLVILSSLLIIISGLWKNNFMNIFIIITQPERTKNYFFYIFIFSTGLKQFVTGKLS